MGSRALQGAKLERLINDIEKVVATPADSTAAAKGADTMGRYAAFVSYRRTSEDKAVAEWVVEALESYRTPDELIRDGVASGVGSIFRDDSELAAGSNLSTAITTALYQSDYLIVVCSRETPRSLWVRKEIALFRHWKRHLNIIPLLVQAPAFECYPPELLEIAVSGEGLDAKAEIIEPSAASLVPEQNQTDTEAREFARDKILCRLLGCDFSKLRDREALRRNRDTTSEYFGELIRRKGVIEGAQQLTNVQAAHRHFFFKVDRREGRVYRVQRVNSMGFFAPDDYGFCQWDMNYRADGSVEAIDVRDRHGNTRIREIYSRDATKIDFLSEDDSAAQQLAQTGFKSKSGEERDTWRTKADITRNIVTFDRAGLIIERRYARNSSNQAAADAQGNYGEGFLRNASGQVIEKWYLDGSGNLAVQHDGVAIAEFEYGLWQSPSASRYLTAERKPILCDDLFHELRSEYDQYGNVIEKAVYDTRGQPCLNRNGIHKWVMETNEKGLLIEQRTLDVSGALALSADSLAAVGRFAWDSRGNSVEVSYFDTSRSPALNKKGYCRETTVYDSRNNPVRVTYFGLNGEPTLHADGFAMFTMGYDERGNLIEKRYFDAEGLPSLNRFGYAAVLIAYDAKGRITCHSYLGTDDRPVVMNLGCAAVRFGYDVFGNQNRFDYFDVNGNLMTSQEGYASVRFKYDETGNLREETYFDEKNMPTAVADGHARATYIYDKFGNPTEKSYFDASGMPVTRRNWCASIKSQFDAHGNEIEIAAFGEDGRPALRDGCQFSILRRCFDDRRNVVEDSTFGIDGSPVDGVSGAFRQRNAYDVRGNIVECAFFGKDGNLKCIEEGFALKAWTRNERGETTQVSYFGADNLPVLTEGGYATRTVVNDGRGEIVEACNFGVNGEPVLDKDGFARVRFENDERGNEIEARYFGTDGKPILAKDGYARACRKNDHRNNHIEDAYFDTADKPVNHRNGYHIVRFEYDAVRRRTGVQLFGVQGEPVNCVTGFHTAHRQYSPAGAVIQTTYRSLEGAAIETESPELWE